MNQADWAIFIVAVLCLVPNALEGGWDFIMLWYWHFRANAAQRLSERLEGAVVRRRWAEKAMEREVDKAIASTRSNVTNPPARTVRSILLTDVAMRGACVANIINEADDPCNCGKCRAETMRRR